MKSVCICGSKRFKGEIAELVQELEDLGVTVYQPSFDTPIPEDAMLVSDYVTSKIFAGLTLEHFGWLKKADTCYLYNKGGYIGTSVTLELGYATALGKPVFALEPKTGDPCSDVLIDKIAPSAKDIAKLLS